MHVTTRAKVNLHLEVFRRRSDGYHEIETVLQSIDLCDTMELELVDDGSITIECDDKRIPTDERNLCHRAVVAMRRLAGPSLGAHIQLIKRIPHGAGLGGGSSNAGGVILGVARGLDLRVGIDELEKVAAEIGSDVPFMLHGGTMLGRGRGEILTPLTALTKGFFVIVKPEITVSTASAYANYSFGLTKHRPRLNLKTANAVLARFPEVSLSFRNALEAAVCPAQPTIAGVLEELLSEGPCFASMSGSGSALFAIFESEKRAAEIADQFSVRGFYTSVVQPANRAVDIN